MDEDTELSSDSALELPKRGCLQRTLRGTRNWGVGGVFGFTNTSLHAHQLIKTATALGSMEEGKETQSLAFPFIMVASANLVGANTVTYQHLVGEFLDQYGSCSVKSQGCDSVVGVLKYILGYWTAFLKTGGTSLSTFALTQVFIGPEKGLAGPLAITIPCTVVALLTNLAVYAQPNTKREYTHLDNLLIIKFLEKTRMSVREREVLFERVHHPADEVDLALRHLLVAHAVAFFYGLQNAILYFNAFLHRAIKLGLINPASPWTSPILYVLIFGAGLPVWFGNYVGYLRFTKELIASGRNVSGRYTCSDLPRAVCGATPLEVVKNVNVIGGVSMKYASTLLGSVELLLQLGSSTGTAFGVSGVASVPTLLANLGLLASRKADNGSTPWENNTDEDLELMNSHREAGDSDYTRL